MKICFVFMFIFLFACKHSEDISESDKKLFSHLDTSFDAEADIRKGDIHLISYGLKYPIPNEDSLTKVFGFYYDNRGCVVSDTELVLEKVYNDKVIKYLEKRNGKGWYQRFNFVYDSLNKVTWDKANDTTNKR